MLLGLSSSCFSQSIYEQPLKSIDGTRIDLGRYKGKKMLLVIVPVSSSDSALSVSELLQLEEKYKGSLAVVGILSEEAGFKKGEEEKLKRLYKKGESNLLLTEGMKAKKGAGQSALLQWLTSKDKNRHFDQDAQGVGSKFFVDESGELYAVMGPQVKLSSPIIDRILSRSRLKTGKQ